MAKRTKEPEVSINGVEFMLEVADCHLERAVLESKLHRELVVDAVMKCRHAKKRSLRVKGSYTQGELGYISNAPFVVCRRCGYAESAWGIGACKLPAFADVTVAQVLNREGAWNVHVRYYVSDEDMEFFMKNHRMRKRYPEELVVEKRHPVKRAAK